MSHSVIVVTTDATDIAHAHDKSIISGVQEISLIIKTVLYSYLASALVQYVP